jgi:hypothetical protein
MTSPNTMPAVNALVSRIALIVGAHKSRKYTRLGATESIEETAPSLGGVDTYVEVLTSPQSQPTDFIRVARMCAMIV